MSAAVQDNFWKQMLHPALARVRQVRERYFGEVGYLTRRLHRLQVALAHGARIRGRRTLAARMPLTPLAREIADALESKGYYFTSIAALGGDPAALHYCRALGAPMAQKSAEDVAAMRTGKSKLYWLDLFQDKEDRPNPILDFVTLPVLLQAAARYLGEVPILSYISLFFTPPRTAQLMIGSQGWHRDNEQMRQMKIFLLAHPVDSTAGPSKLLPKPFSCARDYRNYPGYFTDDQLREFGLPEREIVEFTGEAGSVLLIDTSALFHCGSRTLEQSRLQMIAAYHPMMSNLPYRVFKAAQLPEVTYPMTNEKILRAFEQGAFKDA